MKKAIIYSWVGRSPTGLSHHLGHQSATQEGLVQVVTTPRFWAGIAATGPAR